MPEYTAEDMAPRDCNACGGKVQRTYGDPETDGCLASRSCERSVATHHPDMYVDQQGVPIVPKLPCLELGCKALLLVAKGEGAPTIGVEGVCQLDEAGVKWKTACAKLRQAGEDWNKLPDKVLELTAPHSTLWTKKDAYGEMRTDGEVVRGGQPPYSPVVYPRRPNQV